MQLQASSTAECLGAACAAVWLLAEVCSFVLLHGVTVAEGTAAERAAVRTLTCVDAQVAPQVSSLAEALGAEGAAVWTLTRVRAQVAPQVSRLGEGLAAPLTGVGLLLLLQVKLQCLAAAECLATTQAATAADIISTDLHRTGSLVRVQPGSDHHCPGSKLLLTRRVCLDFRAC